MPTKFPEQLRDPKPLRQPKKMLSNFTGALALFLGGLALLAGVLFILSKGAEGIRAGAPAFKPEKIEHIKKAKYISMTGTSGPVAVYHNVHGITIKTGEDPASTNSYIRTLVETTFYTNKGEPIKMVSTGKPFITNTRPITVEQLEAEEENQSHAKAERLRREANELERYPNRT